MRSQITYIERTKVFTRKFEEYLNEINVKNWEEKRNVYSVLRTHCANLIVRHEKDTTIKRNARGRDIWEWNGDPENGREVNWPVLDRCEKSMNSLSSLNDDGIVTSTIHTHKTNKKVHEHPCSACEYLSEWMCVCASCVSCAHNKNELAARKTENN